MNILSTIFGAARPTAATLGAPQPTGAQAANRQVPPTPGNIPADAAARVASTSTEGTAANGVVPASTDITGGHEKSGLDQFTDLFQTDPNAASPNGQPLFNVNHEEIMASARKQDFRAQATPEQMEAINAGGPQAFAVMSELMNTVAQNAFAQSTHATTRLIEAGLKAGGYAKASDVTQQIKSSSVSNSLRDDNPIFSHPAAAPMLEIAQQAMLRKYPNATPKELHTMAQDYLLNFAQAAIKPQEQAQAAANKKASNPGTDWSIFLDPAA